MTEIEKLRELLREVRSYFKNMPVGMAGRIDAACGCEQPDAFVVARHSKRLVEQLRAENTGLKAECEQLSETVMGQERVIGALEPDARRYQTLRQMHWNDGPLAVVVNPKANVKLGADCPSGERLDQMLDEIDEQRYPR